MLDSWKAHIRVLKITKKILPGWIAYTAAAGILNALLPYLTIYFSSQILVEMTKGADMRRLLIWVTLTLLFYAVPSLIMHWLERRKAVLSGISWNAWKKLLSDKLLSLDYQDLDDPHITDLLSQIEQNNRYSGGGYWMAMWSLEGLLKAAIGLISAIILIIPLFGKRTVAGSPYAFLNSPWFILPILIVMIGVIIVGAASHTKSEYIIYGQTELAKFSNRIYHHLMMFCLQRPECAMDIRIYRHQDMIPYYEEKENVFRPGGPIARSTWTKAGPLDVLADGISVFTILIAYLFVCFKALGGAFGIGEVARYVGVITALSGSLMGLFNELGILRNNKKQLDTLYEFLDLPNRMYQGSLTTEKRSDRQYEVEFRDVSFRYPGSESWALRHVSMKFKVGQRLAFVGQNGSGKTTFIKLLCRLYDPTEGQIFLNGIDIRKYNYQDYMDVFSVVFQDYQLLSFPIGINVAASTEVDQTKAQRSLTDAGLEDRLKELPKGIDTCLGQDFEEEGINVSGGESQKIAIARALYKDGSFLILDEPTASLDPIAEAEIYEKFNDISGDRTAIYISHRLSSCKFCDEIVVFDEGQIVQKGSHEELLADECGKYHELWTSQAKYYQ